MSAIGSVIVMFGVVLSRCGFPASRSPGPAAFVSVWTPELPAGLGDAGQLAAVGHLPQADPAQAELAVDGLRTAATLAAGVGADGELRLAGRLHPEGSLRHVSSP